MLSKKETTLVCLKSHVNGNNEFIYLFDEYIRIVNMKSTLITGITGQDGSYLAELLLEKGYNVYGLIRRLSTPNLSRIEHILDRIELIEGDLTDQSSINNALKDPLPDEVYNLAAQSFVATSWNREVGLDWHDYVKVDPKFLRPAEVNILQGDASKAERLLGWKPEVKFEELVKMMVKADLKRYEEKRVAFEVAR